MNAKWMPALGLAAGAVWLSACLVATQAAETRSLSRSDVDRLLVEAQSAIQAGNLDRATALVERAEAAHVTYPMFSLGPTPAAVRRELTAAQRDASHSAGPSGTAAAVASRDAYAKNLSAEQTADQSVYGSMQRPSTSVVEQVPPSMPLERMPPVVPALHSHPTGEPDRAVEQAAALEYSLRGNPSTSTPGDAYGSQAMRALPAQAAPAPPVALPAVGGRADQSSPKAQALRHLREARQALAAGDLAQAEESVRLASAVGVPESAFLPNEDRPSLLAWDIQRAKTSKASAAPATYGNNDDRYASLSSRATERAVDSRPAPLPPTASGASFAQLPESLELPTERATAQRPTVHESIANSASTESQAVHLMNQGESALARQDSKTAAALFGQAYLLREELNPEQQSRLHSQMQRLAANAPAAMPTPGPAAGRISGSTLIDVTAADEQAQARQMSAAVGKKQSEARRLRETKPQEALQLLQETREQVANSQLSEEYRTQLLRRIDITIDETEKYINDHRAEIEIDEKNQAVLDEVNRNREVKIKVQEKIAELVNEFNRLRDEQRYPEMEVVARRLIELAPDEPVAQQVWQNAKFIRRTVMNQRTMDEREEGFWNQWNDVERASIPNVGDANPLVYDQKRWEALVKDRTSGERETRRTERELEIERRLKTPVLLRYNSAPLSEVVDGLSELAGINIHLDPRGLSQEGVESSTPVTINLSKEISLKSALNLILEPLHLSYVIKDEVLKISSEQLCAGETYEKVYNVSDLVIPIPNFVPNNNIGLQGLINDAHQTLGYGAGGIGAPGPAVLVNNGGGPGGGPNGSVLAQQFGAGAMGGSATPGAVPIGSGPGGMGAGANADFDSLIDLITSTVATETWAENGGGEAEIRPFPTNLSLVISQTQAVHEEIADLLTQLRRLQDLQVTIEVRFIQLRDNFFERIGIDFDANIGPPASADTVTTNPLTGQQTYNRAAPSAIVGTRPAVLGNLPAFTSDLEVPFRQDSFTLATAPFGNPQQVSSFGFAILSEIEAYFLIEAAQGDTRTNVLNAPKVTLFNGQQAFVADASSRPFVIGVIPVVGEFASALQPVIVVLNEGTMMTIQAVVSNDRRYVRLTVVPFFTQVGDVDTFTFEGSTSTTSSSETSDNPDTGDTSDSSSDGETTTGVTVQLPTFNFIAVVTTVSVPDGGTVLLGGIKRLNEGRNELGVPLLSKVPYVNRLFRNVGIGRETDTLMMMVTPRIIIQEEEEERLGMTAADQGTY